MGSQRIKVSIGILKKNGLVLISEAKKKDDNGKLIWEFPGGKAEIKELPEQTLCRELHEELGIRVKQFLLIKKYNASFNRQKFELSFFLVHEWVGACVGSEGQNLKWVPTTMLNSLNMHRPNKKIIASLTLPNKIMITPFVENIHGVLLKSINILNIYDIGILQLRYPKLNRKNKSICELVKKIRGNRTKIMINVGTDEFNENLFDGLHLPFSKAKKFSKRPVKKDCLLSISCHNSEEIEHANNLEADFIYLSPIKNSSSHPDNKPMGWTKGGKLLSLSRQPVYALGGLSITDLPEALNQGFQGIAGISTFWNGRYN
ncbi:MAG: Nudix family hydrolase [Pseudomonadota bacterium]|nr:Nudix family hydrolase [Pseudomonadota bacterium]